MMNVKTPKRHGGLIIKKRMLENTLNDPNIVGLAFTLKKPGKAKNVKLKILAIYKNGNMLVGKEVEFKGRTGAPSTLQYPSSHVNNFKFKFLKKLEEDKFSFGFYSKENFELLFSGKDEFDEVFVGGGKVVYNDDDIVQKGEWFTFTISLRKSIEAIFQRNGIKKNAITTNDKISLPEPNKKSVITINTLEEKNPEIFDGRRRVDSLVLDKNTSLVKGIIFSDDKDTPVLFDNKQKVKSVLLSQQQSLRKIVIETEKSTGILNSEEDNIGLFPNAVHTVPCPPHWPEENRSGLSASLENTIADAVFECMRID